MLVTSVRSVLPALALCVVMLNAGCGDDASRPLPSDSALVEPAQIAKAGSNSPQGVLLQLWRAVQVGNAASAAGFYDQRVLRAIGFGKVSGSLAQEREHLQVLRPANITGSKTPLGYEVVVKAENAVNGTRQQKTEVFSFLFRRSPEGWRVAYDTLLGGALPAYEYSLIQEQVAPGSNTPAPEAQIAARRISDRYRGLLSQEVEQPQPSKQGSGG